MNDFQIFAKPVGSSCNLACSYCYYLGKEPAETGSGIACMSDDLLKNYIRQHIEATYGDTVMFSWHGGEPLLAGIPFYRKALELQYRYLPQGKRILNGLQTNGVLLNEEWCRFLAESGFFVGLSIDGPAEFHDQLRVDRGGNGTSAQTLRGFNLLKRFGIIPEILCVVNSFNVRNPLLVYRYLRDLGISYLTFLPLVNRTSGNNSNVTSDSVPPEAFGDFLITVYEEWKTRDIGRIKIQVIEEALRTAFNQDHTLCIFKKECGGVPVVTHMGDIYSCDHFVDGDHLLGNLKHVTLKDVLFDKAQTTFGQQKRTTLPGMCLHCPVLAMCHGECPKNRFVQTPSGETGLNYLCAGYRKFFTHIQPFISEVRENWLEQMRQ